MCLSLVCVLGLLSVLKVSELMCCLSVRSWFFVLCCWLVIVMFVGDVVIVLGGIVYFWDLDGVCVCFDEWVGFVGVLYLGECFVEICVLCGV